MTDAGSTGAVGQPGRLRLDDVPSWLGWLAIPIASFTGPVGLPLYCYWSYRRGSWEGAGRGNTQQPFKHFAWMIFALGLLACVPLLGWPAAVKLATECFKQGKRVGGIQGTTARGFTSFTALAAAFAGLATIPVATTIVAGTMVWVTSDRSGTEPMRAQWVTAGATLAYAIFTFATLSVLLVAALYAGSQLALARESRQLDCLTDLSQRWSSELIRSARRLVDAAEGSFDDFWYTLELRNADDYFRLAALANFFEDVAILEKDGQITLAQVVDRFGPTLVYYYGIYEAFIVKEQRKDPRILENFARLAQRVKLIIS